MDLDEIKRGLRAEIKKRENEQYLTFQCNVRQMCKDVLAKLEEQEQKIAELEESHKKEVEQLLMEIVELKKACNDKDDWCLHTLKENSHSKYKRCLAMADACRHKRWRGGIGEEGYDYARATRHMNVWLELAEKFKEAK